MGQEPGAGERHYCVFHLAGSYDGEDNGATDNRHW